MFTIPARTVDEQFSDANGGYSPADREFFQMMDEEIEASHRCDDAELDAEYERQMQLERESVDAQRRYPGFARLPDEVLQSILDTPFCPAVNDDPAIQRQEAAAELLRRKIGA